jgi:aldose 1-epimerase
LTWSEDSTALQAIQSSVSGEDFGTTRGGEPVMLFTLTNRAGVSARITNFGGRVLSLAVPDRDGVFENVLLGHDSLADYEADMFYLGALIGRYGNRISAGRFSLDGKRGFDRVVWGAEAMADPDNPGLLLSYASMDGEEGYPGTLSVRVMYSLSDDNRFTIKYTARTDRATPINLTSHCYYNLAGDLRSDILGHWLTINADRFTPVGSDLIPTGEIQPVDGTPLDFRSARPIGDGVNAADRQIEYGGGYDHNFVLNDRRTGELGLAARLFEPGSGRVMECHTTEPGLQFYSGNSLGEGKNRTGLCLETQHFPDSPNQPGFPSTILRPGREFSSRTVYSFSTVDQED